MTGVIYGNHREPTVQIIKDLIENMNIFGIANTTMVTVPVAYGNFDVFTLFKKGT